MIVFILLIQPDWFEKDSNDDDGGGDEENDDSGEAADGENSNSSGTHHILILMDCDHVMFTTTASSGGSNNDDGKTIAPTTSTYMNECLKAIQTVVRNKIRTVTIYKAGKRDGIGIILYNTKFRTGREDFTKNTLPSKKAVDEDEDDDDEDDDLMLFGSSLQSVPINVHEFIPLEPPGVSTMELIQRSVLPTSQSTSMATIDLEKEYSRARIESEPGTNEDDVESKSHLPPLLYALRKALIHYSNASCVKKAKTSSAAKWEEPDSKHIWIITPHDYPCRNNATNDRNEMIRLLQSCVNDIQENDIQLHVWPIVVPPLDSTLSSARPFDRSIFYNSITTSSNVSSNNDGSMTADDWVNSLDAVYKKTRPAYRVPFLLPNWKQKQQEQMLHHVLFLDMYNLHQVQKEPSVVYIHQSTGKVLGKVRQLITLDDGGGHIIAEQRSFDPSKKGMNNNTNRQRQLQTFFEFGSEYVPFSLRDKVSIKKKCNTNPDFASLILLGFKPATEIPFYHTIEKSYFAYPSEFSKRTANGSDNSNNSRSNSIDAIAHLHASMVRQNVIGIGELLTRATATSRLVVIRPIREILRPVSGNNDGNDNGIDETEDEVYMLVRPPGLLITALPFEDEMRSATSSTDNGQDVSEEMIHAAMNLIEQQTFDDDVEIGVDFTNASMSRFWNYIEHIAYNEDAVVEEKQQYDTEINAEQVLERSGEQIDQLLSLLPQSVQTEKTPASGRKRKTATTATQPLTDDTSGLDWTTLVKVGTLSKCTVADLKLKLRSVGEPVIGNKAVVSFCVN